ncbi:MAG: 5'-nucleotidase C-terminal domain-containing protein, partial [Candidatus Krumholzibacteria bacterium]|nr:5'-nucleotidase C-terminal domain-containing protein [Candidatus Krumholzibacteria bacterium]
KIVVDLTREDWDRVCRLEIAGEPWDPDRIYKVVVTNFLMEGNSGLDFLTTIPADKIMPSGVTTAEAVEAYIRLNNPARPMIDDRWVAVSGAEQADYLKKAYLPES